MHSVYPVTRQKLTNNKLFIGSFVLLASFALAACSGSSPGSPTTGDNTPSSSPSAYEFSSTGSSLPENSSGATTSTSDSGAAVNIDLNSSEVQTVSMTAEIAVFTPNVVRLKQGLKAQIKLTALNGNHSFVASDLALNVPIQADETKTFDVPTDKAGTFEFHCGVPCGPGHSDMTGQIIVE